MSGQTRVVSGFDAPCGYQQITSTAAATSLTIPSNARWALIQAEAQAVRWRDDVADPTASIGMLIPVNTALEYTGRMSVIRVIAAAAGAIINISYYG